MPSAAASRQGIYYWKCDRAAAFHGTSGQRTAAYDAPLRDFLRRHLNVDDIALEPGAGQGNHQTYLATISGQKWFVRLEDGPERDAYKAVEAHLLDEVRAVGVPAPRVLLVDDTRAEVPFAVQVIEYFAEPDLNQTLQAQQLDLVGSAATIGRAVATWQGVPVAAYGPFDERELAAGAGLQGLHDTYGDYFRLNLDKHLRFLVEREFLAADEAGAIHRLILDHNELLELPQGVLAHKDLALWNILGGPEGITAFIDWDDAIAGDPTDDLSLLACFHDAAVVEAAVAGYASMRPLPTDFAARFWLHLLRNMIVKSVIRVGAGYFDRTGDFFLLAPGSGGAALKEFTLQRLRTAVAGLEQGLELSAL